MGEISKVCSTDLPEDVWIPDPSLAMAYYCCVFGAVAEAEADDSEMKIGERRYRLVSGEPRAEDRSVQHEITVRDADVAVARVATKGGRIEAPVAPSENGRRVGRVRDPFGQTWLVNSGNV